MKKGTITFLLSIAVVFSAISQSLSYQLDTLSRDSFYLVETLTGATTKEVPRPETRVAYQLFRDTAEVMRLIEQFEKDAKEAQKEAEKYQQAARLWAIKARGIRTVVESSEWFSGKPNDKIAKK